MWWKVTASVCHSTALFACAHSPQFPAKLGLPAGAPVYVDGASSGGSLALRLPRLVKFGGVIGGGWMLLTLGGGWWRLLLGHLPRLVKFSGVIGGGRGLVWV